MKKILILTCLIFFCNLSFAATITMPDDVAQEVVEQAKSTMEQWARAKIGSKVNSKTPDNLYQDLKTRAIQDAGFSAVDSKGNDLLNKPVEIVQ